MAEPIDPNAAPMHHDIHEKFAAIHIAICGMAGAAAVIAGIVAGVLVVNK